MQFVAIHLVAFALGLLEQRVLWMLAQPFADECETAAGCCSTAQGRQRGLYINNIILAPATRGGAGLAVLGPGQI